ncbi:CHASE3 domain-containing protein [Telluria mixta]|uniref:histidine kinase n=1 Tax=Telluria mixta TaxID=34071 RepID=A0ABT2BRR7_9BURK|nr:CHASE3 domain-containing protein [Telluria mixta]MCS0627809.1 CHASE3 domain-containing protein [Telluria mixta]WEM94070.1 CHASE3 domain-containing protein [Telluria mixta]
MFFTTDPRFRPVRSLPLYQTLLCVVCVLILVLNGVSLVRNLDGLKTANARQAQADRVTAKLQYLNLLVTDAESGLRGYYLSGSDTYLGPLRTAERELDGQFNSLKTLLADNPSQLKNLTQLQNLVVRRINLMNQGLEVYRHGGLSDIVAIAQTQEDKTHMDEIRLQVVIMTGEQNETLAARSAVFYDRYRLAALRGLGINVAALVTLVLFYNLIRRSFRARLNAERALQQTNDHLESLVTERTEQLSVLSRHLIRVSEEEKAKLARELHDEMGANLTAIGMHLASVTDQIKTAHPDHAETLGRARAVLVETVELKRRIVEDLRPSLLDNLGLSAALQSYCEDFGRTTGVDCEALIEGDIDSAGSAQSIALFRIAQESLNNVAKYAQARHVVVHLAREGEAFTLEVSDDGVGIPPDAMRRPKSHGLLGMRERALLLGGTLRVDRGVNGIGTTVHAIVPVTVPGGTESGGTASGGTLDIAALAVAPSAAPAEETPPEPAAPAEHQLHSQLRDQLRAAQAQSSLATAGRDALPLMRATRPSAGGHTRF